MRGEDDMAVVFIYRDGVSLFRNAAMLPSRRGVAFYAYNFCIHRFSGMYPIPCNTRGHSQLFLRFGGRRYGLHEMARVIVCGEGRHGRGFPFIVMVCHYLEYKHAVRR